MVGIPSLGQLLSTATTTASVAGTLVRSGVVAPMRPDKYVRIVAAARREGLSVTSGFTMSAQRSPNRVALIDEIGALTFRQLDERSDALAVALQGYGATTVGFGSEGEARSGRTRATKTVGVMCRNHRGFVEALIASIRIGANVLLLNTSFAGPALAEVVNRENVDVMIYDEEFTDTVDRALADRPDTTRVVAWTDNPLTPAVSVEKLIDKNRGRHPEHTGDAGRLILLTSGTTGTPKGAKHSGGGVNEMRNILERIPWRTDKTVVVVAPMFHAWGFSQLVFAASLGCTVVTRRKFDPEATLELIDRHRAYGLCVVPVMFDRIMALPDDVRRRYSGRSLRFASASGSRMRPDVVTAFMDQFGDIIYNNYNATEAGMIATATPADLRAAPDTAGRPAVGTEIRILDPEFAEVPTGEIGQIFVRNGSQFDGYTSGSTKDFHDGFMASGDLGRFDSAGRLFVVGRDDEMIVSGGENVYPIEVEKTLVSHDGVAEASVLGVDDAQYGQRLVAFVVLAPGSTVTPEELKTFVRDNLSNFKVPRAIIVLDELPRNNTGKVLRRELQARADETA